MKFCRNKLRRELVSAVYTRNFLLVKRYAAPSRFKPGINSITDYVTINVSRARAFPSYCLSVSSPFLRTFREGGVSSTAAFQLHYGINYLITRHVIFVEKHHSTLYFFINELYIRFLFVVFSNTLYIYIYIEIFERKQIL